MKKIFASGTLMLAVLGALVAGCEPIGTPGSAPSKQSNTILRTEVGDGIWVVGTEIGAGYWSPEEDLSALKYCKWFVSPAEGEKVKGNLPSNRDPHFGTVKIQLKAKQSLTTDSCGNWQRVG